MIVPDVEVRLATPNKDSYQSDLEIEDDWPAEQGASASVELDADSESPATFEEILAERGRQEASEAAAAKAAAEARRQAMDEKNRRWGLERARRLKGGPVVLTPEQLADRAERTRQHEIHMAAAALRNAESAKVKARAETIAQAEALVRTCRGEASYLVRREAVRTEQAAEAQAQAEAVAAEARAAAEEARARGRAAALEILRTRPTTPAPCLSGAEQVAAWDEQLAARKAKRRPKPNPRSTSVDALHWKARMLVPEDFPADIIGSRRLGEVLLMDHKAAHRLAKELESLGLMHIEPFESENWEPPFPWMEWPNVYSLTDKGVRVLGGTPQTPTTPEEAPDRSTTTPHDVDLYLSTSSTTHTRVVEEEEIYATNTMGRRGASQFRLTEDRFAERSGRLGRGVLAITRAAEARGKLGQPVTAGDLATWSGAHRNDVGRWLAKMNAKGVATHNANRTWTLNIKPSITTPEWDRLVNDFQDYGKSYGERRKIADRLNMPVDDEQHLLDLSTRHRFEEKTVGEWTAYAKPEGSQFRHHRPVKGGAATAELPEYWDELARVVAASDGQVVEE